METRIAYLGKEKIPTGEVDVYRYGECNIFKAIERERLHISISHPSRLPTWDEIKYIRYNLALNKKNMAMFLPPKEKYVNVDENCFHLWEVEDDFFEGG